MIAIQAYRVSVGLFQSKVFNFKLKSSTYGKNGDYKATYNYRKGSKIGLGIKIVLLLLVFGANLNNSYNKICKESNNKINHTLNGNIPKKGNLSLYT